MYDSEAQQKIDRIAKDLNGAYEELCIIAENIKSLAEDTNKRGWMFPETVSLLKLKIPSMEDMAEQSRTNAAMAVHPKITKVSNQIADKCDEIKQAYVDLLDKYGKEY